MRIMIVWRRDFCITREAKRCIAYEIEQISGPEFVGYLEVLFLYQVPIGGILVVSITSIILELLRRE